MKRYLEFKGEFVFNKRFQCLGIIKWDYRFKCHCFEPDTRAAFSYHCLDEISEELKRLDSERKDRISPMNIRNELKIKQEIEKLEKLLASKPKEDEQARKLIQKAIEEKKEQLAKPGRR